MLLGQSYSWCNRSCPRCAWRHSRCSCRSAPPFWSMSLCFPAAASFDIIQLFASVILQPLGCGPVATAASCLRRRRLFDGLLVRFLLDQLVPFLACWELCAESSQLHCFILIQTALRAGSHSGLSPDPKVRCTYSVEASRRLDAMTVTMIS